MQFSAAAASAAFASKAAGGMGHDGRLTNPVDMQSTPKVLKNKRARQQVASRIVNKLQDLQQVVECDPKAETEASHPLKNIPDEEGAATSSASSSDSASAELGILSSACGVGRQCQDGLCVDVKDFFQKRSLQAQISAGTNSSIVGSTIGSPSFGNNDIGTANNSSAMLPGDSSAASIVDTMLYACEYGSLIGYNCTCDFDPNSEYSGSATCITPTQCSTETSVCGVDVTDCYESSYSLTLKGSPGVWDAVLCLTFLEPYVQTVCYETSTVDFADSVLPECTIRLNDETCNSCDVYSFRDGNCYNFDCGNTVLAGNGRGSMAGNTCSLPAHSVGLYLDTFGCPPCFLCDDGEVMGKPAATMELFNTTYQCAYVQDVALQGFFTTDSCNYFARIAREPCGCGVMPAASGNETELEDLLDMEEEDMEMEDPSTESPVESSVECNICPEGVFNPDGVITGISSGSRDTSCSDLEVRLGTPTPDGGGVIDAESCRIVQVEAAGPCCGAIEEVMDEAVEMEPTNEDSCTICGPNKTHSDETAFVSVPTQGIYSCKELIAMGQNGTLDEKRICLLVQLSAQTPCGCSSDDEAAMEATTVPPTDASMEKEVQESGAVSLAGRFAALAAVVVASGCLLW